MKTVLALVAVLAIALLGMIGNKTGFVMADHEAKCIIQNVERLHIEYTQLHPSVIARKAAFCNYPAVRQCAPNALEYCLKHFSKA